MRMLVCCLLVATVAEAAPVRRLALVIGANRGDPGDQPLRFAEDDATRMSRVLSELGGFAKGDVVELRTPDAPSVERAMAALSAHAADEARAGRPPLLLFYYSGHADAESLHLAGGRIALASLRTWLAASPAAVRLVVLDSCKSGALTRVKGAHGAPAIEVRLSDDLNTRGEAVLTSSTSDEMARESDGLRGSFFTHHLVTGLRGAADRSKDGRVTLAEAYDYAYAHTVSEASGGQHPTFKYDLAGRGEVVLTSLGEAGAWIDFAAGSDGMYLIIGDDGLVMGDVEVGKTPLKVAVAPGRYEVRKRTAQGDFAARVTLEQGEERWIHDEELGPVASLWQGPPKGAPSPPEASAPPSPPEPSGLPSPEAAGPGDAAWDIRRIQHNRARGIALVGIGLGNLAPTLALEISIFGVNRAEATAILAPLTVLGFIATSALVSFGGYLIGEARRDARPDLALGGATTERDLLARAHAHGERRRDVGARMLGYGGGTAFVGAILGGIGATVLDPRSSHNEGATALMAFGFFPAAIGLGVAIAGSGLFATGRHEALAADAGRIDLLPPPPSLTLAPVVLRDGAGLGLSGSF